MHSLSLIWYYIRDYFLVYIMSVVQTNWNPLNESPEAAEAARRADEDFERRWEIAFDPEQIKQATWIGEVPIEDGFDTIETARINEELDSEDPEEILLWLETNSWEELEVSNKQVENTGEFWPLFDRFHANGNIDSEALENLQQAWINSDNFSMKIQAISVLTQEQKDEIISSIKYLTENNTQKASEILQQDFWEIFSDYISEWWSEDITWESAASLDAYQELCSHFIAHWDKNQMLGQLELWFDMASNSLASRVDVQMWWNEVTLQRALQEAKSSKNLKDRFAALVTISWLINTWAGAVWKRWRQTLEMKQARDALVNAWLVERFKDLQKSLLEAQQNQDQQRTEELQTEITEIEQSIWIEPGDSELLAGGLLDTLWDDTSETTREA